MPRVNGRRALCACGASVFRKLGEDDATMTLACNACGEKYEGDKPARAGEGSES